MRNVKSIVTAILRSLRGITFGLIIFGTALFGGYVITLFLPLVLVGRHELWRKMMDRAISFWMLVPTALLERLFGVDVRVSGDLIDVDEPALVIMNHRTRLDWMYLWCALFRQNPWLVTSSKITLKKELKSMPAAGFGMAASHFVFLERKLEADRAALDAALDYFIGMGKSYQLLIFPEGTDRSPWTAAKSDEHAKKNGLRQLNYLIHPRQAGFVHLVEKMRANNYLTCVYDVTVAYPRNIVQSEVELVALGKAPKAVHFHVEKIDSDKLPKGSDELGDWLHRLWLSKEDRLAEFYGESQPALREFSISPGQQVWTSKHELGVLARLKIFSLFFYVFVVCIWLYHLTFLRFLQIGFLYFVVCYVLLQVGFGGIDRFVYERWRRSTSRRC